MAKKKQDDAFNLDNILFKCRDILRQGRNSGSFFEKRDMMLTLVFLRFIGEKFEDGIEKLRQQLIADGLDPEDPDIQAAFFEDATFTDGTYFCLLRRDGLQSSILLLRSSTLHWILPFIVLQQQANNSKAAL